jgi:hypothetical protein
MDEETLHELVTKILAAMHTLSAERDVNQQRNITRGMMNRLYELGLYLHREPAKRVDPEATHFFEESARLLPWIFGHIEFYFILAEDWFYSEWTYDEWVTACRNRSAIAFLFEFYKNTPFQGLMPTLLERAETLDNLLRKKVDDGVYTPYDAIPSEIPTTHWWWWYPEVPPG